MLIDSWWDFSFIFMYLSLNRLQYSQLIVKGDIVWVVSLCKPAKHGGYHQFHPFIQKEHYPLIPNITWKVSIKSRDWYLQLAMSGSHLVFNSMYSMLCSSQSVIAFLLFLIPAVITHFGISSFLQVACYTLQILRLNLMYPCTQLTYCRSAHVMEHW